MRLVVSGCPRGRTMAHVTCQNYEIFGARVSRDLAGLAHCNRPDFSYRASMARWPTYNFSREKSDVLSVRGPWCRHLCPWDGQRCRASRGSSHRVNCPRVDSSSNLSLALVPPPTYGVENEKSDGSSTHRAPPNARVDVPATRCAFASRSCGSSPSFVASCNVAHACA